MYIVGREKTFVFWSTSQRECSDRAEKGIPDETRHGLFASEFDTDHRNCEEKSKQKQTISNQRNNDKNKTTKAGVQKVFRRIAAICRLYRRRRRSAQRNNKSKRSYVWQRSVTDAAFEERRLSTRWKIDLPSCSNPSTL